MFTQGPSEPRNVQVQDVSAYNVTVGWEIPQTTNGDIKKYQLSFQERYQLQGTETTVPLFLQKYKTDS